MREKIVAGNWKMNTNLQEGISLANEVVELLKVKSPNVMLCPPKLSSDPTAKVIICPPFVHLYASILQVEGFEQLAIGAQNCSSESKGAFTGEVSAEMIKSVGAKYVIIGHSERRSYFHEDNMMLAKKVNLVLANNLKPIYCCGETLQERELGRLFDIIKNQLHDGLFHLSAENFTKSIIAYEPVWAIGTGVTATTQQAQDMHFYIRGLVEKHYGIDIAQSTTLLYGGSCNAKNAKELFACPDVDGGLIGGASLKAADFIEIVNAF